MDFIPTVAPNEKKRKKNMKKLHAITDVQVSP